MSSNYSTIIESNLKQIFAKTPTHLEAALPSCQENDGYGFQAFGESCRIASDGIFLNDQKETGPLGIVISLYGLHASPEPIRIEPLRAYKEFPDSMPYAGAFRTHTEMLLVPHVAAVEQNLDLILSIITSERSSNAPSGDFTFLCYPLPKVALCYIFYRADEEFPASATCLYSSNANKFLPIDALADVGEYTSRKIIDIVKATV